MRSTDGTYVDSTGPDEKEIRKKSNKKNITFNMTQMVKELFPLLMKMVLLDVM
ncbi:hypothetical protein [Oceanobacillus profundus]|uniref:hypothetical protein n=1 Tax=Oceanobacillus profundus TaxID=372463 RepID=UPI0036D3C82B